MAGRQGDYLGQQQQGQYTKHDTNAQQEQDIGPVGFCAGILGALLLDDLDLTLQFAHLITAFAVYMFNIAVFCQFVNLRGGTYGGFHFHRHEDER